MSEARPEVRKRDNGLLGEEELARPEGKLKGRRPTVGIVREVDKALSWRVFM